MSDPLESALFMLARAKHHFAEFKGQVGIYDDSNPFVMGCDYDSDADENVYTLKLAKPIPVMLNGIASDAICNLRSALDQAGYAASIEAKGKWQDTYFPFGEDPANVKGHGTGRSKEIPKDIFAVMESFKPYKGGDDFLWALNKMANANKHRILYPMAVVASDFVTRNMALESSGPARFAVDPVWDRQKNEMELARITPTPDFDLKYHVEVTTCVSFAEPEVVFGPPAITVLDALIGKVDSILMAVEAEGRRIGLFR